jgi:DNA-binding response OmpR family regulator
MTRILWQRRESFAVTEPPTKVLIASAPGRLRDSLRTLLAASTVDIRIVGIASSWMTAMAALDGHPIDVVIVDSNLPGKDAWTLLRYLKASNTDVRSLFLADDATQHAKGWQAGADMVLLKGFAAEELNRAFLRMPRTHQSYYSFGHEPVTGKGGHA